jgi:hypothetical protein
MTDPAHDLAEAERRAAAARERLSGTVAQLQSRLDPRQLAREAKDAGTAAALAGVDGARRHPGIVAGAVGATTLLLARHRLMKLFFRRKPKRVPATPIDHSAPRRTDS